VARKSLFAHPEIEDSRFLLVVSARDICACLFVVVVVLVVVVAVVVVAVEILVVVGRVWVLEGEGRLLRKVQRVWLV